MFVFKIYWCGFPRGLQRTAWTRFLGAKVRGPGRARQLQEPDPGSKLDTVTYPKKAKGRQSMLTLLSQRIPGTSPPASGTSRPGLGHCRRRPASGPPLLLPHPARKPCSLVPCCLKNWLPEAKNTVTRGDTDPPSRPPPHLLSGPPVLTQVAKGNEGAKAEMS